MSSRAVEAVSLALLLAACGSLPEPSRPLPIATVPVQAKGCSIALEADLPARIDGRVLLVEARAGDAILRLLVDTGDSGNGSLGKAAITRLGLGPAPSVNRTVTVSGRITETATVDVPQFSLGGLPPRRVRMAIAPGDHDLSDGILGFASLVDFDIEIDPEASRLRLFRTQGCGDRLVPFAEGHDAIPLRIGPGGLPLVPVRLDGREVLALVDTGAAVPFPLVVLPGGAERLGLAAQRTADLGEGSLLDWSGASVLFRVRRHERVEIGTLVESRPIVAIVNTAPTERDIYSVADAILGSAFLLRRRVWLSPATGHLYVGRRVIEPRVLRESVSRRP